MHRSACAALLIVTAITPEVAVTQQLAAGDSISVRLTRPEVQQPAWGVEESGRPWTEARVVRITRDTLWYRTGVRVEQLAVGDAEVRRPTGRDHRVPGMVLGGISGAVIGGVAGYLSFQPEFKRQGNIGTAFVCAINDCGPVPQSNSRAGEAALGALMGVSIGVLLGYVVGRSSGRWESVDLIPTVAPRGAASIRLRVGI